MDGRMLQPVPLSLSSGDSFGYKMKEVPSPTLPNSPGGRTWSPAYRMVIKGSEKLTVPSTFPQSSQDLPHRG